jgi:hypothetical protein
VATIVAQGMGKVESLAEVAERAKWSHHLKEMETSSDSDGKIPIRLAYNGIGGACLYALKVRIFRECE